MRQHFGFQDVIDVIGEEAASLLVAGFGGTTLGITKSTKQAGLFGEVAAQIGDSAARKLFACCAGCRVYIPTQARGARLALDAETVKRFDGLTAGGMTARRAVKRIALELSRTDRTVWRALKRTA